MFLLVKPLFRLSQQGLGKQPQLDNIGGETPYHHGVVELQKILQVSIGVLIRLATDRAILHHVDEPGFELKVDVPNVNTASCGGDGELKESLLSPRTVGVSELGFCIGRVAGGGITQGRNLLTSFSGFSM